jgi:hypothetical protein
MSFLVTKLFTDIASVLHSQCLVSVSINVRAVPTTQINAKYLESDYVDVHYVVNFVSIVRKWAYDITMLCECESPISIF